MPLLALLVSACASYSHSHNYPPRSYAYQPRAAYYQPNYQHYPPNYAYYGSYQPGWFINMGYGGGFYGSGYYGGGFYGSGYYGGGFYGSGYYGGGFYGGPAPYWPTYSFTYYQPSYYYAYPYYDPWYYSYSGYKRNYYGYGHGYGWGAPYGSGHRYGYGYANRSYYGPYYGASHAYRPPGQQSGPQQRPDPVVVPRDQRGRRGYDQGYRGDVAERPHQQGTRQLERRSATVVTEQQGISQSVSLVPGNHGDQGMVVSSRSERKIQPSRLHPVAAQPDGAAGAVTAREKTYGRNPARPEQPAQPVISISSISGYESPQTGTMGNTQLQPGRVPGQTADRSVDRSTNQRAGRNIERSSGYAPPGQADQQTVSRSAPGRQQYAPAPAVPAYTQQPAQRSEPSYQQKLESSNVIPRADRRQQRDSGRDQERQNR